MKQYISETRAIYEDNYHGLFSKKLAEWAILKMKGEGKKPIEQRSLEDTVETLKKHDVYLEKKYIPTAWYLFNMAIADYPKTLKSDEQRVSFVDETLFDPDGSPCNVLDCFVAKMCNAKEPIFWEDML